MDLLGQSALLVGVTSFALGFSVLARNVRNKLFIAYAVLTTVISLWALMFTLDRIWPDYSFYRWHLFLNIWLAPAGILFIISFARIRDAFVRRIFDVTLIIAMSLSLCLGLGLDSADWVKQAILFSPGVMSLLILRMILIDRRSKPTSGLVGVAGVEKRRGWIYLGGLFVLSTSVMDHVPWMGHIVPSIGNVVLIIFLFFTTQAITQQRFLNFEALVSRFFVLLAVALTLTGVYSILVGWIKDSPPLFFLNSFIASFLILMLLDPLRAMVGYFTERLVTQKHLLIQQTLKEAQRKLVGTVDLETLFQDVLQTTEQLLNPEWGAVFVLMRDGTRYRRMRTSGPEMGPELREMIADHPLIEHCLGLHRKGRLPIVLDLMIESEIERSASRRQREHLGALIEALKALGCNLFIPLIESGKILGFAVFKVDAPPAPWGTNWGLLPIIFPYYEQAAQTLRGMEVFVRSREKERLAALGEMAAGLAHEIRNPLGAIKGAAQFLDPTADRPESQFLRIIIEETDRLNRVVTQFLDYSKPSDVDMKEVNLSDLVKVTVERTRPSLDSSKVKVEFQPAKNETRVMANPEQIQQVILNLIQNSVKALESRSDGLIQISVESQVGEVAAVVSDNGKGIKKENIDKLFIPFFTTSPSGTGLGLSISQKIIEAHRGRIDVATEEGRFTRFSIVLPQAKQESRPEIA